MKTLCAAIICIILNQLIATTIPSNWESHYQLSKSALKKQELQTAAKHAYEAFDIAQSSDNQTQISTSCMQLSLLHHKVSDFKSSLRYAMLGSKTATSDDLKFRNIYNSGIAYYKLNNYDSAMIMLYHAYDYFLEKKDTAKLASILNFQGLVFFKNKDYSSSRKLYSELLDIASRFGLEKYKGFALNNIGNSYLKEGKPDSARLYLEQALLYQDSSNRITTYLNLAQISEDPVPNLLAAINSYSSLTYMTDYAEALSMLRESDPKNKILYNTLLADLTVDKMKSEKEVQTTSDFYQLKIFLQQRELDKVRKDNHQKLIIIIACLIGMIIAILIGWSFFRKHKSDRSALYEIKAISES